MSKLNHLYNAKQIFLVDKFINNVLKVCPSIQWSLIKVLDVVRIKVPDGVAKDEADNDEDQHFCDGMIATLVRRYGIVTLRRATDLSEDQAVQDKQDDHRDEYQGNGVGDENVVAGVRLVLPEIGRDQGRHHDLLGCVSVVVQVVDGHVSRPHFGPELEEPRDVEEERADDDRQCVDQVIALAEVARLEIQQKLIFEAVR